MEYGIGYAQLMYLADAAQRTVTTYSLLINGAKMLSRSTYCSSTDTTLGMYPYMVYRVQRKSAVDQRLGWLN
jgi:hypothetical protein